MSFAINNLYLMLIIIIIYFIFLYLQPKRHYLGLPTFSCYYPSNEKEIIKVKEEITNRTEEDILLFNETDKNEELMKKIREVIPDVSKDELFKYIIKTDSIAFLLKIFYNRARPYEYDKSIDVLPTAWSTEASYPSGHAFCGYAIAKKYSKIYPEKSDELYNLINRITEVRVKAGVHYPGDMKYAKYFIDKYYDSLPFIFH